MRLMDTPTRRHRADQHRQPGRVHDAGARREGHRADRQSKSKLVYQPLPPDDPKQRQPDIGKAKALLGWSPEVQFDEGLDRTIAFFRQRLQS